VGYVGYVCLAEGTLGLYDMWDMSCLAEGTLGLWDMWDMSCLAEGTLGLWDMSCLAEGAPGLWDMWDMSCLAEGPLLTSQDGLRFMKSSADIFYVHYLYFHKCCASMKAQHVTQY